MTPIVDSFEPWQLAHSEGILRLDAQIINSYVASNVNTGGNVGTQIFPLTAADFSAPGKTTQLLLRGDLITNNTAPLSTFQISLLPATVFGGAAATCSAAFGAAIASTGSSVAPAANTAVRLTDSGPFTFPADGMYALVVVVSNVNMAVASAVRFRPALYARHV